MPMVVYTEEEMIEASNLAVADALRNADEHRTRYMTENTQLRNQFNDLKDLLEFIAADPSFSALENVTRDNVQIALRKYRAQSHKTADRSPEPSLNPHERAPE